MLIRLFQEQDSIAIAKLFHDTIHEINIRDYSPEQVSAWSPEDLNFIDWAEFCTKKFTYIAEEDEKIIGFGQLQANGHIDCFYCHKDYQRCGVGTRLYRTIEAKALELKIERLFVEASITVYYAFCVVIHAYKLSAIPNSKSSKRYRTRVYLKLARIDSYGCRVKHKVDQMLPTFKEKIFGERENILKEASASNSLTTNLLITRIE